MNFFIEVYKTLAHVRQRIARGELVQIVGALIALALTGMIVYGLLEGWSALDALYATVITITTVGYGDFTPHTSAGRLFAIVFTLMAITIGGYSISTLAAYTFEQRSRRAAHQFRKRLMKRIDSFNQHYILCGADLLGIRIAEELQLQNADYVIIERDETLLKMAMLYAHPDYFQQKIKSLIDFHDVDLSEFEALTLQEISERVNVPYLLADPTDDLVLIKAGIERAAGLIAACPDDRDNLSIIIGARSLAKRARHETLRIMTRANEPRNMRKMYLAGADFVRIPSIMGGIEMASHMLHPEIGNWWYSRVGADRQKQGVFQQVELSQRPQWIGQTVGQIHQREQIMIVSVKRGEIFVSPPPADFALQPADIAIMLQ
jgi:voltage-gated potassium channel